MKSLGDNNLIKLFLKNSPRTLTKQFNAKLIYSSIPLNTIISNKGYLNKFLVEFDCQHLVYPLDNLIVTSKYSSISEEKSSSENKTSVLDLIKKTQRSNVSSIILVQAEQKIQMLSSQQSQQNIKYLMFLEKSLKKNRVKIPQRLVELNRSLIATVEKKIQEGVQRMKQNNQSKNLHQNDALLSEARKKKQIGDVKTAKQKYQEIYQNESMDEQARLQALEYLCIKSIQKGDKRYLQEMDRTLQSKGLQKYKELIKKCMQTVDKK